MGGRAKDIFFDPGVPHFNIFGEDRRVEVVICENILPS